MKAHHWDWLHALTFALAIIAFGDTERRVVMTARTSTWPTVQATVIRSVIDTFAVTTIARHGVITANRRIATYRFTIDGRPYTGQTLSWHPRNDAVALAVGARVTVHYQPSAPAENAVFAPPRFTVWIESILGIALVLVSGLPWHRWDAHRRAANADGDPEADAEAEPITLHVPPASGAGIPANRLSL